MSTNCFFVQASGNSDIAGSFFRATIQTPPLIVPVVILLVHPTEACADPRIEVFQGMAAVSHDLMKNRPR